MFMNILIDLCNFIDSFIDSLTDFFAYNGFLGFIAFIFFCIIWCALTGFCCYLYCDIILSCKKNSKKDD